MEVAGAELVPDALPIGERRGARDLAEAEELAGEAPGERLLAGRVRIWTWCRARIQPVIPRKS